MKNADNFGQCENKDCGRFGELREDGQCLRCNPRFSRFEKQTGDTPQGEIQPLQEMYKDDTLASVLKAEKENGASYHQLQKWLDNGEERGITHMDIKRVIDGQMPKSARKRKAMRLHPVLLVPACPFPNCNKVHTHKHDELPYTPATQHPTPNRKPRQYRDLFDTPAKLLRWQLENRNEVCPAYAFDALDVARAKEMSK